MNFLEKDLEEIIFSSSRQELENRGLYIGTNYILLRQKRIGNYGIADLIQVKTPYYHSVFRQFCKGEINVIELKQDKIGISAFLQALGYLKGIRRYLEGRNKDHLFNYTITLIGKTIDLNSSFVYLSQFTNEPEERVVNENSEFHLRNFLYQYNIDGLSFEEIDLYKLSDEGF
jgi:hypothetical protein